MQCNFQNVTDILMQNMASTATVYYNNLLNHLFASYLRDAKIYEFDRPTAAKLHKGTIRVSPEMSDYYLTVDRKVMWNDIQELLPYLFDKPTVYQSLYTLIQYDDSLSVPMRQEIFRRIAPAYRDEASLVNMIYEAVYVAVTRQYEKQGDSYIAVRYTENLMPVKEALFSNSEYIPPCSHFCGRDKELRELHTILSEHNTVIITGVAGIGKSELIRAYVKEHRKSYTYIGYYFYNGSLKEIIAGILRDPTNTESNLETRYRKNLALLHELSGQCLLVIDNFNVTAEQDACFADLCDLKCRVVFTSHMRYEDYTTYTVGGLHHMDDIKALTSHFYRYKPEVWDCILEIYAGFDFHTFCIELCAKAFAKGALTPRSLYKSRRTIRFKDFAEKLSAKKDKHPKKKTYYDHIRELFSLLALPERHKQVLRVMTFAPYFGFRKDFFAQIMNLNNMVIVEDLLDVGLLYENHRGRINMQSVIAEVVRSELETNNENCSAFAETVRALCRNEAVTAVHDRTIQQMAAMVFRYMDFRDSAVQLRYVHDCFTFTERFGENGVNDDMIAFEREHHDNDPELKTLYLSDAAAYEMTKQHLHQAVAFQLQAAECAGQCDNLILQANTFSTCGYYLNLADRKDEAMQAMQTGLALFGQLDGDGVLYFDKYRAVINYADLLFSLGHTHDAVRMVADARNELQEHDLQDTELYADCEYALGLYHLCLHDSSAGEEIASAFRTFISLYGTDSDFVQTRISEVKGYAAMNNVSITGNEPLQQLLG